MVDSCSGTKGFSPSALVFPSPQKQTSIISDKLTCSKADKANIVDAYLVTVTNLYRSLSSSTSLEF